MDETQATVPAETIAALAVSGIATRMIEGVPHLVMPQGYSVKDYSELLPAPIRLKKQLMIQDVISFISYFQIFGNDATMVFADDSTSQITAVFDYHQPGKPSHCDHKATLHLTLSDEWKVWHGNNSHEKPQRKFAEFIEDNIKDITNPTGASLLEITKSLTATKTLSFKSATELSNGQVQLMYSEVIDGQAGATGQLEIPKEIGLGLRIYKGQEAYAVTARLRYRITGDGVLTFSYHLNNVERLLEDAFGMVRKQIEVGCKATAFINT